MLASSGVCVLSRPISCHCRDARVMRGSGIDYMTGRQKAALCQSPRQMVTVLVSGHGPQDTVDCLGFPPHIGSTPFLCPVGLGRGSHMA